MYVCMYVCMYVTYAEVPVVQEIDIPDIDTIS